MIPYRHPTRRRKPLIAVRQAFSEFLLLPLMLIAGFLILAAASFWLDRSEPDWIASVRAFLAERPDAADP